jgi:hypothetical protein
MINPISSSIVTAHVAAQVPNSPSTAQQPATKAQEDSVHLSSQARSAAGDVDHDGNSH